MMLKCLATKSSRAPPNLLQAREPAQPGGRGGTDCGGDGEEGGGVGGNRGAVAREGGG